MLGKLQDSTAIVVVENVERVMVKEGLSPNENVHTSGNIFDEMPQPYYRYWYKFFNHKEFCLSNLPFLSIHFFFAINLRKPT